MSDRRGAEAGLVREDAAANALCNRLLNPDADGAAHHGGGVKCAAEDHAEHGPDVLGIGKNHRQTAHDIDERHNGNQFLRHAADPL
ncbi:hypothetical protein SDC9_176581 [bioreactor metagenome]|uniref:Uncharacterized protein n=1 Tax=bioreactor metagenome TaxID=1076179 RepID=A0A645GS77_9ZZZZ